MAWLRLIRWNNLVIIFLTQLLAWACIIVPSGYTVLDTRNFSRLSMSTMLVAAAGYIINDYFDIKIDLLNRPQKVILGKAISLKQAIACYITLNIIALILAGYVAMNAHHVEWLLLQIVCVWLLWLYSKSFKRGFMTGNIVVSLLSAFTIITLIVYEPSFYPFFHRPFVLQTGMLNPLWILCFYAWFAFILSWMREVVKDMEDCNGDAEQECMTMPVKWGLSRSASFVQVLGRLVILSLCLATYGAFSAYRFYLGGYIIGALILPIAVWLYFLNKGTSPAHYHKASTWLKIIMLAGIGTFIFCLFAQ